MYALAQKAPLSGPQKQQFNYTMRHTTLHKTYRTHIYFRKLVISNRVGSTETTSGCARAWHVVHWAWHVVHWADQEVCLWYLLKPSRCNQICSECIAATCDRLTISLVTLYWYRFTTVVDNRRLLSMTPNFTSCHDTLPGIWVCNLPLAILTAYLWNTVSWNLATCYLVDIYRRTERTSPPSWR